MEPSSISIRRNDIIMVNGAIRTIRRLNELGYKRLRI